MVRVSSQYFPVWIVYRTVRKKDFVFLARVSVSSQLYRTAQERDRGSRCELGLAVIFQFGMCIVK